jgi:hypothetical protein
MRNRQLQFTVGFLLAFALVSVFSCGVLAAYSHLGVSVPRENIIIRYTNQNMNLVSEKRLMELEEGLNSVLVSYEGIELLPDSLRVDFTGNDQPPVLLRVSTESDNPYRTTWLVHASAQGHYTVTITYLTDALPITITYAGYLTGDSMSLKGTAAIENNCNQVFREASLFISDDLRWDALTLTPNENKELPFTQDVHLPIKELYVFDPELYGNDVMLLYELKNTTKAVLPTGTAQVFKREEEVDLVFVGEDAIPWLNQGQEASVLVGNVQDILVEKDLVSFARTNFRRDNSGRIQVYDTSEQYSITLTNRRELPATVLVTEHIPDPWRMISSSPLEFIRKDAHTLSFEITLQPNEERTVQYHIERQNLLPGRIIQPLTHEY